MHQEILRNVHYLMACYNVVPCADSLVSMKGFFPRESPLQLPFSVLKSNNSQV